MKGESVLGKLSVVLAFAVSLTGSVLYHFTLTPASAATPQGKGGEVIAKPTPAAKKPATRRSTSARAGNKPSAVKTKTTPPKPAGTASAAEVAFWNLVKDSTKPEDFRSYLNAYPNGQFAHLARERLSNLEKPGSTATASPETVPPVYAPPTEEARKAAAQRASEASDLRNRLASDFGTTSTDYGEVENKFRQAIALDPGNRNYHNELAYTLHLQHKSSEAESIYRQSVKAVPSDAKYRYHLATFLWEVFKFEEALSEIRAAVQLEPDGPYDDTSEGRRATGSYRYTLADYLRTMRRFSEAEAEFSELIRRIPKSESYRSVFAELLQELSKISAAENILREGVRLFPDGNARSDLRRLLIKNGRLAEAETIFRQRIAALKPPVETGSFFSYAFQLSASGKNKEAEEILREGLRLAPPEKAKSNIYYRGYLAKFLRKQDKLSEAEAEIRQAIGDALRLDQSYLGDFRQELAYILTDQGKVAEADAEWKHVLRVGIRSLGKGSAHAIYADWLVTQNRLAEAEAEYKEAVRLSQGHMISAHREDLANFLTKQNRCAEAEVEYRKVIEEQYDAADTHLRLARCLEKQNKLSEAETEFKEALRRFPFDPAAQAEVGDFFSRRKKWKEAETAYREAVRLEPAESKYKEKLDEVMNAQKTDKPPVKKSAHSSAPDAPSSIFQLAKPWLS